jgi:allantoicase
MERRLERLEGCEVKDWMKTLRQLHEEEQDQAAQATLKDLQKWMRQHDTRSRSEKLQDWLVLTVLPFALLVGVSVMLVVHGKTWDDVNDLD